MEEYVYDLENTWTLNIDMFQNMLEDFSSFPNDQKKNLYQIIARIRELFLKKKNLREDKQKLRGKVLMDKQILEEFKRRNEENHAYYQEQMEEFKENLDKKDSFIKQFEKKFNEVEIFVQREAKTDPDKWDNFLTFEILGFIANNEMLQIRQMKLMDEIKVIKDDMKEILRENVELKKRDEFIEDPSEDYGIQMSKYNSLIKLYKSKIKFLERNSEHLRSVLSSLNCRLENVASYNTDLNSKLKNGDTKPNLHKKINSVGAIKYNEKKLKTGKKTSGFNMECLNEGEREETMIKDTIQESNENESMEVSSSDDDKDEKPNDKSHIETWTKSSKKKKSYIEDHSIITKTPEFNLNKENWDISCIETFPDI